jgi:hypothetical protein
MGVADDNEEDWGKFFLDGRYVTLIDLIRQSSPTGAFHAMFFSAWL